MAIGFISIESSRRTNSAVILSEAALVRRSRRIFALIFLRTVSIVRRFFDSASLAQNDKSFRCSC